MDKQQIIEQIKKYFGIDALTKEVKIYIDLQTEIIKTSIVEGSSKAIFGIIKGAVFAFLGLCIFIFGNLVIGFGLSEWFFNSRYWTGFFILTLFYSTLALIFAAVQSFIQTKVEKGVSDGIKGTPLELTSLDEITYPEKKLKRLKEEQQEIAKTSQKNIEKEASTPSNPNLPTQNENNVDTN
ncbi:phage holin family protein [Bernardetia sp. OM2101]|uniref:phage holin family protein n=1 Tax=Bernardetia sp. OM2101 TaxID=3344876 RepID=UPI0035D0647C